MLWSEVKAKVVQNHRCLKMDLITKGMLVTSLRPVTTLHLQRLKVSLELKIVSLEPQIENSTLYLNSIKIVMKNLEGLESKVA